MFNNSQIFFSWTLLALALAPSFYCFVNLYPANEQYHTEARFKIFPGNSTFFNHLSFVILPNGVWRNNQRSNHFWVIEADSAALSQYCLQELRLYNTPLTGNKKKRDYCSGVVRCHPCLLVKWSFGRPMELTPTAVLAGPHRTLVKQMQICLSGFHLYNSSSLGIASLLPTVSSMGL